MNNYYDKNNDILEKEPLNSQTMQEIYSFLENLKPTMQKDRARGLSRAKVNDMPNDDREKYRFLKANGLNDNIQADYDYKNKARKGLQFLLYKMSGGNICPNIKEYYKELRDKFMGDMVGPTRKDIKRSGDINNINNINSNKNIRRQNLFDKFNKRDSVKSDEGFKLNFNRQDKNNLNKNSTSPQGIIPKRRLKRKKSFIPTLHNTVDSTKQFKNEMKDEELKLFYSDKELEDAKNKFAKKNSSKKIKTKKGNIKILIEKSQTRKAKELEKDLPLLRMNTRNSSNNFYNPNNPLRDLNNHTQSKFALKHSKTKLSFIKYNIINSDE
jgi:hypothetical protein